MVTKKQLLARGINPYPRLSMEQSRRLVDLMQPFAPYTEAELEESARLQRFACALDNEQHRVLDHGYIQVMASMGDDSLIASLAVATRGHTLKDDDHAKRVISNLLHKKHLTVFEHVVFRLRIKCPVFVARQLMRYRAAVYLEDSRRHLTTPPEFYLPVSKSSGQIYTSHYNICMANYYDLLDRGEPPEQARIVLPLAMYTGYTVTLNARSLIHILDERLEPDAQWETRQYAQSIMDNVLAVTLPVTYELWKGNNQ